MFDVNNQQDQKNSPLRGDVPLSKEEIALELTRIYVNARKNDFTSIDHVATAFKEFQKAVNTEAQGQ